MSAGAKGSTAGRARPVDRGGRDGVGGDGEQRQRAVDARLLQQAAAPAHARDGEPLPALGARDRLGRGALGLRQRAAGGAGSGARAGRRAVGRERQVAPGGDVAQHLVAAVRARGDDGGRGLALDQLLQARRPRGGRVGGEPLVLGHVRRGDAVRAEPRGGLRRALADQERLDRIAVRQPAREREGLQGELVDAPARVLHQHEHRHATTPRSRITSTTAGAASGPLPRIAARLP